MKETKYRIDTVRYIVPVRFLPYLFNADLSGLEDDEAAAVEAFDSQERGEYLELGSHTHWSQPDEPDLSFEPWHDLAPYGVKYACDCEQVDLVIMTRLDKNPPTPAKLAKPASLPLIPTYWWRSWKGRGSRAG